MNQTTFRWLLSLEFGKFLSEGILLLGSRFKNRLNTEGLVEFDRGCLRKFVKDEPCRDVEGNRE